MKYTIIFTILFLGLSPVFSQAQKDLAEQNYSQGPDIAVSNFEKLVWSDEFDEDGEIDATKWFHQTKLPNGSSWYNNEIQHYTNRIENSHVDTGYLFITAMEEEFTDQGITKQYTSARLNSKYAFTYGKVEIRAKLPTGVGTWPAMWTLGKNVAENGAYWQTQGYGTTGWPECGEIDIMEHWGSNQNFVSSAMHTPSSYGGTINKGGQYVSTASTEFHVYKLEWSPQKMVFSIDDVIHYTYNPAVKDVATWPFDEDQYLLLNVAILPGITDEFTESSLVLDYIRIYEYSDPSSFQHINARSIACYPNPFTDEITVDMGTASDQDVFVKILDSSGRIVKTNTIPNYGERFTLNDLEGLSSGLYLISCRSENKHYSIMVEKR